MLDEVAQLRAEVSARYGVAPDSFRVVRTPYRVCPLGAHIDHQLGKVTAMALDRGVLLAYAPTNDRGVRLSSLAFPGEVSFALDHVPDRQPGDWGNFPRGAVRALQTKYSLRTGLVGVTTGSIHEGGLSSSAAIGVACLLALEDVNELNVSREENVDLDQHIENDYLGLRNGILDQAAILMSRRDQLTVIDCATRQCETVPPPCLFAPTTFLIAFSGLYKALVRTDYNRRVAECVEAARILLTACERNAEQPVLGLISADEYAEHRKLLFGASAKRAAHFFSESERVEQGIAAWRAGNLAEFGRLMSASGESSISNYECGSPPLIDLYKILIRTPGVLGARFSGAGFRGCCVAFVNSGAAEEAIATIHAAYSAKHPDLAANAGPPILCQTAEGAEIHIV